jgi:hypothetical protein
MTEGKGVFKAAVKGRSSIRRIGRNTLNSPACIFLNAAEMQSEERTHMKQSGKSRPPRRSRALTFPQARGRMVEKIEWDHHSVTIRFQDNTDLEVRIHPALTVKAVLYDWKGGSQRALRRWPAIAIQGR